MTCACFCGQFTAREGALHCTMSPSVRMETQQESGEVSEWTWSAAPMPCCSCTADSRGRWRSFHGCRVLLCGERGGAGAGARFAPHFPHFLFSAAAAFKWPKVKTCPGRCHRRRPCRLRPPSPPSLLRSFSPAGFRGVILEPANERERSLARFRHTRASRKVR